MKKTLIYCLCTTLITGVLYASETDYATQIQKIMTKNRGRTEVAKGVQEIRGLLERAATAGKLNECAVALEDVMGQNSSEYLLLNAAIVTDAKTNPTIISGQSLESFVSAGEGIVSKELEQYRSVKGLLAAYERFLSQDINRLLLNDFPDAVKNKAFVAALSKALDEDGKALYYLKKFTPANRDVFSDFIAEYYQGTLKTEVQAILDSNSEDKQAALDELYKRAALTRRQGYLENVLVEFYKVDLQRSALEGTSSSTPVKNFFDNLMNKENDRGLGSLRLRLGTVWVDVMQESSSTMTEQSLIDTFNFLSTSPLEIDGLSMKNSPLRTVVWTLKAIQQLKGDMSIKQRTDWIVNLRSNLSTNDVFNKFPRLWMVIAKNTLDAAAKVGQTDRVITVLNKSIPRERGWNKFKKNVKSWFGEYCSLHRLRLKMEAKKATDADRYKFAEGLITEREITSSLTKIDRTPEELCLSIRVALQSLQGDVTGQPASLLKALQGAEGVTLQMIQTEVIDRLPQSIRASFMQEIGQQQLDNSFSIDPSDEVHHDPASIFEGDGVPKKPSSAGSSRGKGASSARSPVSVGSRGHLTVDTHGMTEEELREHLAENDRLSGGSSAAAEDHSGDMERGPGR